MPGRVESSKVPLNCDIDTWAPMRMPCRSSAPACWQSTESAGSAFRATRKATPKSATRNCGRPAGRSRPAILERGHDFAVVTQFSFDAEPVFAWLEQVRKAGIVALVRVGVPGPASVKRLLAFAARCGVGASTKVMKKYGLSLTKLLSKAGPDQLIQEYATGLDPARHGEVLMHIYPFGGLRATAEWVRDFRERNRGRS
jgi:hypothetical protein